MEWDTELQAREALGNPNRRVRYVRSHTDTKYRYEGRGRIAGAISYEWPSRTQVRGWVVPRGGGNDRHIVDFDFDSVEEAMQRVELLAQLEGYS